MANNTEQSQQSQFQKDFALATQTLRQSIAGKSDKTKKIITDWIIKWASYLVTEDKEKPYVQRKYKPGQVVLVDFGFRIGNELGGRHYAVVVEDNCNPKSGMIMLVPLRSYNLNTGKKKHINNIDLGIDFIGNNGKGSEAVISQVGAYSKVRIENVVAGVMTPIEKYNAIIDAIHGKMPRKKLPKQNS